ncbi:trimeric intracellular cation channel family protein [Lysobacter pythonis]|uniref:Trimeric intracellular cation channel family protein n=1 Tax=Solilutibacter pythonis TaxID=2483112 RepID=A0A3M2HSR9_9GAMM|nr:trimeric intracellular cation channel family protein [Lysobacter pythonis]RMH90873.1 trimeric intracellular cation channel family protein [Lysobacter pythonis]
MHSLMTCLDLIGTFVFALSGATLAVRHRLDLFGVLVLAFATASAGGIARDVLIGAVPPAALSSWHYPAIWIGAGLAGFFWSQAIERAQQPVRVLDAMGLAVFAVAGTAKALEAGISPLMAPLLGVLTGVGGGIVRDVLLAQVPLVLRAELYAVAAFAGGGVVALGAALGLPPALTTIVGAVIAFTLRIAALRFGWNLPVALQAKNDDD